MSSPDRGTYLLVLWLAADCENLRIGQLGSYDFAAGTYLYVGSAFGSGGLVARLAYHRQRDKARPHWHIDYLRPHCHLTESWSVACSERLEQPWCRALMQIPQVTLPIRRFGASDTALPTHLFYLPRYPAPHVLSHALLPHIPWLDSATASIQFDIQRFPLDSVEAVPPDS